MITVTGMRGFYDAVRPDRLNDVTRRLAMSIRKAIITSAVLFTAWTSIARAQETIPPPTEVSSRPLVDFVVDGPARGREIWVSADYLFGFVRGMNLPAMATTSPPGTIRPLAGVLGVTGTETLFGGFVNQDMRSGFRVQAGYWFGGERNLGLEAGFYMIGGQSTNFSGDSTAFPILARPYTDARNGTQQAVLVAFPGRSVGTLDINASAGNFSTFNLDITENAYDYEGFRLTAMIGYRCYRYDESVTARQSLTVTDPRFVPGTVSIANDSFSTRNEFHGFDMGFRTMHTWGAWSLEGLAKVAVGDLHRRIDIAGDTTTIAPGGTPAVLPGGVLALPTNIGNYESHEWKVMPEVGAALGWQVRPNLSLRLGYSLLVLSGVARAADQIDPNINPNFFQPPNGRGGQPSPAPILQRTEMWLQSINVGVLWTY